MATIAFTAIGFALGGPIGGAIGAVIGSQVDQSLFGPGPKQGPRLSDLSVQTSSYGKPIPKIFGTMRASGTVIWATDLHESSSTSGGKGGGGKTSYSYSVSFAVQLSARPITGIGRIWADGNLLRGQAGDWKTTLNSFALYLGGEDQSIDPFMASAQGISQSPAYRGKAYAVFEGLQLANYGNRIPSLSFEIFADDGSTSVQEIVSSLGAGALNVSCSTSLMGYAASGSDVQGAVETLTAIAPVSVWDDGAQIWVQDTPLASFALAAQDLGATTGASKPSLFEISRQSASTINGTLTFSYYDITRDYQQGMQQARREGGARKTAQLNVPVTLDSARAKAIVENKMSRAWLERASGKLQLPWRYLNLVPGTQLSIPRSDEAWRVRKLTFKSMVLEVEVVRISGTSVAPPAYAAPAGQVLAELDVPAGATHVELLDLPMLDNGLASAPNVVAAVAGASTGWRGASLNMSLNNGASYSAAGYATQATVIGTALTALGGASAYALDTINSVQVQLLSSAMSLHNASDDALLAGANLAMIGQELIQFGSAVPLGNTIWQLSRLLRGRRGSESAIATHNAQEAFVLLDTQALVALSVPNGSATARVQAQGVGDAVPVVAQLLPVGRAVQPLSPVAFTAQRQANGDYALSWVRRSRNGWDWLDGIDAPLGEEQEQYILTLTPTHGAARQISLTAPQYTYSAANYAADGPGARAGSVQFSVVQSGTYATSLPAILSL